MSKGISSSQKRKSKKELMRCFFKDEWEEQFLFIQSQSSKPVCLIYFEAIAVMKKSAKIL